MHQTMETKPEKMKDTGLRFSIQVDPHDPNKALSIIHMPPLNNKNLETTEKVIRSKNLIWNLWKRYKVKDRICHLTRNYCQI